MTNDSQRTDSRKIHQAGAVSIDTGRRVVSVSGRHVALERRAYDLLAYLLAHRDRVVSKDELWREVWEGRPVSDSVIPRAVSKIRRALGEDPPNLIETVHGVGYRFNVPVEIVETSQDLTPVPRPRPRFLRAGYLIAAIFALAVLITTLPWIRDALGPDSSTPSFAILPVEVDIGDDQLDWARLGLLPIIEHVLDQPGSNAIGSSTVLSTLRRNPKAATLADQARILRANTGAQRILLPRLESFGGRYQLTISGIDEPRPFQVAATGADPVLLAVNAAEDVGDRFTRTRSNGTGSTPRIATSDPFVNEAYARGLDARLRSEWEEARNFFETVLSAAPELDWARYQLSLVTRRLGDWQRTRELNEMLLQSARAAVDRELEGSVLNTAGILAWREGDIETARESYEAARDIFREIGSTHSLASAVANLAILASIAGDFDEADRQYRLAASTYRDRGDDFNLSAVMKNMGVMNLDRGRLADATEQLNESLAIRQRLGLRREASLNLSALADIELRQGRLSEARSFQTGVLKTAREVGDQIAEIQALTDLAIIDRLSGRQQQARSGAAEALYRAREIGNPAGEVLAMMELARACQDLGDSARARELAADARDLYRQLESPPGEESAILLLAEIALDQQRAGETQDLLDAAFQVTSDRPHGVRAVIAARLQARLFEFNGNRDEALDAWTRAVDLARESSDPYERILTESGACLAGIRNDRIRDSLSNSEIPVALRYACLAEIHANKREPGVAQEMAQVWRRAAGDAWTEVDQARFERLGGTSP